MQIWKMKVGQGNEQCRERERSDPKQKRSSLFTKERELEYSVMDNSAE